MSMVHAPLPATETEPRSASVAGGRPRRRGLSLITARPWLLLAPGLVILAVLMLWPLIQVVVYSLQDYGLREINTGESNWIGFQNYIEALTNPTLWTVVLPNTVGFAAVAVFVTVAVGTLVALLLARLGTVWRTIVSSCIMVAWAMPAVTGTYVWTFIFDADRGIFNSVLRDLGLMDDPVNWFTNQWSFYAIVLLNVVHHGFPFVAITVLAGLLGVSKEMLEAAALDGANAWTRFWKIIFPTLRPVFSVVIILSTIWDFKVFAQVYLMPGGGGGNRQVLNLGVWSYVESFGQNRYGFGAALAVLLTLVLIGITIVYIRSLMKEDEL
ncbi:sugar ABC transporter permease [Microbacterium foliorum]|uniref:Inner membrane ABC transporter permease protein YcjO n=1 Tax=Microbacterium foliorum TaxID=104336 RepID=A0A0F0KIH2_9MICO|nr:sugar ABC transporter permease [Microbacterium foliorum]AXL11379.1 sugar ABC transporter permease [Microbacterium foliorum]KJL19066.1 Inner membrane ABC transporter permease protein YcjO [Microbacterium foliorum]CAH0232676.1 Inner membrane ABC transporter permease protein YcjO [Microbacterium foliorum]CAH0245723.1 Inner membrane ABC transporter permease protein YcjO [Microbacterium foliorum]